MQSDERDRLSIIDIMEKEPLRIFLLGAFFGKYSKESGAQIVSSNEIKEFLVKAVALHADTLPDEVFRLIDEVVDIAKAAIIDFRKEHAN